MVGVADRHGKHKLYIALVASAIQFLAKPSSFFAVFDKKIREKDSWLMLNFQFFPIGANTETM